MTRWWHVSWKRVGIALLVVFLTPPLLAGIGYLVLRQLRPWLMAREIVATYPEINSVPVLLPDNRIATLSGGRIERFGYSLQLPWKDIVLDRIVQDIAFLTSKSDVTISLRDPFSDSDSAKSMRYWAKLVPAFNEEPLRSNYVLWSAALAERPEQVKWWKTPNQNAMDFDLLLMKETQTQLMEHGILYAVSFNEVRGFQQGNPSIAPYNVRLDLFDSVGQHYEIKITPRRAGAISQEEINAMMASLRPVSGNSLTAAP